MFMFRSYTRHYRREDGCHACPFLESCATARDVRLPKSISFEFVFMSTTPCGRSCALQTSRGGNTYTHAAQYDYASLFFDPRPSSSMLRHTPYKMGSTSRVSVDQPTHNHLKPQFLSSPCQANTETSLALRVDTVVARVSDQTMATGITSVGVGEEEKAARPPLTASLQRPTSRRAWTRPRSSKRSSRLRVPQHWKTSRLRTCNTSHPTTGSTKRSRRSWSQVRGSPPVSRDYRS